MANKTFYLDRETDPLNPALEVANKDELIKVYDDTSDMESDISNIEDDEIVSCKGNDYEGVHVTDTVSNGNLNPVTSNAVYQAIDNLTQYNPNYVLGEIDTGATWIDGKHIYRNTLVFDNPKWDWTPNTFSVPGISLMLKANCIAWPDFVNLPGFFWTDNWTVQGGTQTFATTINVSRFLLYTDAIPPTSTSRIIWILEYTKTE
jgi:hypothetical protein